MTRHVSDNEYLGYEISIYENGAANYSVDVKRPIDNQIIAAYGMLHSEQDALVVGRAYVSGREEGRARPAPLTPPEPRTRHGILMPAVLSTIAGLVSDGDGENPEYDRALVEVTGRLLSLDLSDDAPREAVLAMLRAMD